MCIFCMVAVVVWATFASNSCTIVIWAGTAMVAQFVMFSVCTCVLCTNHLLQLPSSTGWFPNDVSIVGHFLIHFIPRRLTCIIHCTWCRPLLLLSRRALDLLTDGILGITINPGQDGEREEAFIKNYGTLTFEQVVEFELQLINDKSWLAQDTYILYKCLMALLTSEAKKKVSIWSSQYRIGNKNEVSGVALLKVIICESHLDTNATTN